MNTFNKARNSFFSLISVALLFGLTISLHSAPMAGVHDTRTAVQYDSPAVVRIISEITGSVVCYSCSSSGGNVYFPAQANNYYYTYVSGSGAIISPDGYILTADHVVDATNNIEAQNAILQLAEQDYATTNNISLAEAQAQFQQYASDMVVTAQVSKTMVYMSTSYIGQLQNTAQVVSYQATRIVANSTPDKQDVAIIKIEASDLPFITLNTTSTPNIQDQVTAIAFPGDADYATSGSFIDLLTPANSDVNTLSGLLSPSVNSGQISSEKTQSDGTLIYEVTGISAPGSSGGPVINTSGAIIGFVDAGTDTQRLTYLIASSIVKEYVQQAGVATQPSGAFMSAWEQALNDYNSANQCHWQAAKTDLQNLKLQYPTFNAIQPLLQTATTNGSGSCSVSGGGPSVGLVALIILALGSAAAGVYYFVIRKNSPSGFRLAGGGTSTTAQQIVNSAPNSPQILADSSVAAPNDSDNAPTDTGKHCANGHLVQDQSAKFCPSCGAPIA